MKSFLLVTIACIIGFTVCEAAVNSFGFKPLEAKQVTLAPNNGNKCPLSKTIVNARIVCTARFDNESDPFEGFGKELVQLATNFNKNDEEKARAFVEKHRELFLCIIESTGIVKYDEDGKMELDETNTENILSDSTTIDPTVAAQIERELKPCVTMNEEDKGDVPLCVLDAINRACDYGFMANLAATQNP